MKKITEEIKIYMKELALKWSYFIIITDTVPIKMTDTMLLLKMVEYCDSKRNLRG